VAAKRRWGGGIEVAKFALGDLFVSNAIGIDGGARVKRAVAEAAYALWTLPVEARRISRPIIHHVDD
jgi:hypothetical protein